MQKCVGILGHKPKRMIAYGDFKLISGVVADYLKLDPDNVDNPEVSHITGSPSDRQNQNDLAEIRWKNIMSLYKKWLTSNLLPIEFWYFAIKYVVQVINYIPFIKDNKWTTLVQCIYKMKPDYKNIIPIFSITYVKRLWDGLKHRSKTTIVKRMVNSSMYHIQEAYWDRLIINLTLPTLRTLCFN